TGRLGCRVLISSSSARPSRREPCSHMSRKTSRGTRSAIDASALSASCAVRVSCPSSLRIPATSSRMSSSSSTIRISDAISDLLNSSFVSLVPACSGIRCRGRQDQADHSPLPVMKICRRVVQFEPTAMVLDNLLDDGEAKSRALVAGRHIGLQQPLPVFTREALSVVDDVYPICSVEAAGANVNDAANAILTLQAFHRLGRVLHHIAKSLRHQPAVESAVEGLAAEVALEGYVGPADLHEEGSFAQRFAQVDRLHLGFGHSREGREFIDHPADILYLADDRIGALVENLAVLRDDLSVAATDALGRKLDWSEGVLDLVRNTPRNISPCRRALGLDQIGNVVHGHDIGFPAWIALVLLDCYLYVECALGARAIKGHLLAIDRLCGIAAHLEDAPHMRQQGGQVLTHGRPGG